MAWRSKRPPASRCSKGACGSARPPASSPSGPCRLTETTRRIGLEVLEIVDRGVEHAVLAPYPKAGACEWCDFRAVCGAGEERRTGRKVGRPLPGPRRAARQVVTTLRRRAGRCRRPRSHPDRPGALLRRRGGGGDGQDHGAGRADHQRARLRARRRHHRQDRRGDLHREGRRRTEAAPARGARGRASARDRREARAARAGAPVPRRGACQHRSTASAPTCCASGRSRRGSIRSSRS